MKKITKIIAVSAILTAVFFTGCSKKTSLLKEYFDICQSIETSEDNNIVEQKAKGAEKLKKLHSKLESKKLSEEEEKFLEESVKLINMKDKSEKAQKIEELKKQLESFSN